MIICEYLWSHKLKRKTKWMLVSYARKSIHTVSKEGFDKLVNLSFIETSAEVFFPFWSNIGIWSFLWHNPQTFNSRSGTVTSLNCASYGSECTSHSAGSWVTETLMGISINLFCMCLWYVGPSTVQILRTGIPVRKSVVIFTKWSE